MALTNFTLPFGGLTTTNWAATISPLQPHHATAVNNLLYGPAGHQESDEPPIGVSHDDYYKNNPYSPPQNQQYRSKSNNYLPPPPPPPHSQQQPSPRRIGPTQQSRQPGGAGQPQYGSPDSTYTPQGQPGRTYGEGKYGRVPTTSSVQQNTQYQFNNYNKNTRTFNTQQTGGVGTGLRSGLGTGIGSAGSGLEGGQGTGSGTGIGTGLETGLGTAAGNQQSSTGLDGSSLSGSGGSDAGSQQPGQGYPIRPPGYTRVQAGQGTRTQVHAVLDYDADEGEEADYYDDSDDGTSAREDGKSTPTVTPIQGPIFLKNGTVPVVPLFSYPTLNNGTFVQIPIWWTALSVALGLDIRGDIVRGVPCVKRYHQLFCPTAGNSYPIDKIEKFIDDNKALMRRMYGDFEMTPGFIGPTNRKRRRSIDEPDFFDLSGVPGIINRPGDDLELVPDTEHGETYFGKLRKKRQNTNFRGGGNNNQNNKRTQKLPTGPGANPNESSTGRVDACESKIEIVTPYWAANSAGKIRAIVNTQHFEQAIHQEICTTKVQTARCSGDCGCEQKYKWHRLLAYDPDNDCKGIFMDWFLFPSCCVCRCQP